MRHTLSKEERISSKKLIQELFTKSSSFYLYPFVVKHSPSDHPSLHRVLISVSKRKFKTAVKRNLLKRRTREAYRLNKHLLDTTLFSEHKLNIGLIYSTNQELGFDLIEKKLILILERLTQEAAPKQD